MPQEMITYLTQSLGLDVDDVYLTDGPLNLPDFMFLYDLETAGSERCAVLCYSAGVESEALDLRCLKRARHALAPSFRFV